MHEILEVTKSHAKRILQDLSIKVSLCKVDRLLTGLTAEQIGKKYSNKTHLYLFSAYYNES